jgi:transcriptional regulator with XRE-family HTH domain
MTQQSPTLGQVLAGARKQRKLSLREVVPHIRKEDGQPISPQYLNDIEHDRRIPSPEVLDALIAYYDLPPDWLHYLAGSMPPDIKAVGASEAEVVAAFRAFRKKLDPPS